MDLSEIRNEIDIIDKELKDLFEKRMSLSKQVASVKAKSGDPIYKPDREAEIIDKLSKDINEDYREDYIGWIKQMLLSSRNYQKKLIDEINSTK